MELSPILSSVVLLVGVTFGLLVIFSFISYKIRNFKKANKKVNVRTVVNTTAPILSAVTVIPIPVPTIHRGSFKTNADNTIGSTVHRVKETKPVFRKMTREEKFKVLNTLS